MTHSEALELLARVVNDWSRDTREWKVNVGDAEAALRSLEEQLEAALDALDKGRRFERAYQESLGATPTAAQWERLDSLQSAFLDAYLAALESSPATKSPSPERAPANDVGVEDAGGVPPGAVPDPASRRDCECDRRGLSKDDECIYDEPCTDTEPGRDKVPVRDSGVTLDFARGEVRGRDD